MAFSFNFDLPIEASAAFASKSSIPSQDESSLCPSAESSSLGPQAKVLHLNDPAQSIDARFPSNSFELRGRGLSAKNIIFHTIDPDRIELPAELRDLLEGDGVTDLVKGVYEGGFKIWEGSLDLVRYLDTHRSELNLTDKLKRRGKSGKKKRGSRQN